MHGHQRLLTISLSLAYLRPYVDLASEILTESGNLKDFGGRYTFAVPGQGCLLCAQAIDPKQAAEEYVDTDVRERQRRDGYIVGSQEPAASVMALNAMPVAAAVNEIMMWLTSIRPARSQLIYAGSTGIVEAVDFDRWSNCDRCGSHIGLGDAAELGVRYEKWELLSSERLRN